MLFITDLKMIVLNISIPGLLATLLTPWSVDTISRKREIKKIK